MKKNKLLKVLIIVLCIILVLILIYVIKTVIRNIVINNKINDNINTVVANDKYRMPVAIEGIDIIEQKISCGYACIQMYSKWLGKEISEQKLYEENNSKITTSTADGLKKEFSRLFTEYNVKIYKNLKNTEMITRIYNSLDKGMPVIVSLAAVYNNENESKYTLHYGIINSINMEEDTLTVYNPYGYVEEYSIEDFLKATRFEIYNDMDFFTSLGVTCGVFSKNTIIILESK